MCIGVLRRFGKRGKNLSDFLREIRPPPTVFPMPRNALHIAWKLTSPDSSSIARARIRLTRGEERSLYRLHSANIANGEAQALLTPNAPLEHIVEALWDDTAAPVSIRWGSAILPSAA